jgi:hypothetical protein
MLSALLGACGGGSDNTNATGNANTGTARNTNTATNANTNTATSSTNANTAAVLTTDKIGVPECDDYIAKYEACSSKIPEAMRATYKNAFDTSRKAWRDAAATPQGKAGLATACKAANDAAKQSLGSFGCSW